MPWEDIGLVASEGIDPTLWLARALATMNGVPLELEPVAVAGTTQTNRLRVAPADWDSRMGQTVHLVQTEGVPDPSGNVGNGVESQVAIADLGAALPALPINGSELPLKQGFFAKASGDPACEAGQACAVARFDPEAPPIALAGRILLNSQRLLRIRLMTPQQAMFQSIRVLVVAPSGAVSESVTGTPWSWTDVAVPLPAGLEEVAVLVFPTGPDCAFFSAVAYDVAIGSISAE